MRIKPLCESLLLCREAGVTAFIWGHRGLGKSSIARQTAVRNHLGFSDMRLSQCEASDLRGMPIPDRENNTTCFLPPSDLPQGGIDWKDYIEEKLTLPKYLDILQKAVGEKTMKLLVATDEEVFEDPETVAAYLAKAGKIEAADTLRKLMVKWQRKLNKGILFLDEMNRAQDDVIQAAFQLVLDHRLGDYVLPSGWSIACAGNFTEGYMVNGFTDPAFLDRFCHLIFSQGETTAEEWVEYMVKRHGVASSRIIEYTGQNFKHLDGDLKGDLGFSILPSRRSWEFVVKVEEVCRDGKYSDDAKQEVIGGLVGKNSAIGYLKYSCPVKPADLISDGIKAHHSALKKLKRPQLQGLMWGMVSHLKGKVDDDRRAAVAVDFAKWIVNHGSDKDLAVAYTNLMVGGTNIRTRTAIVSNPNVAKLIGKFRTDVKKKTFADRIYEDKELQDLMRAAAWGEDDN